MGINFITYYLVAIIQIDLKVFVIDSNVPKYCYHIKCLCYPFCVDFYIICLDDTIFCKRAILK